MVSLISGEAANSSFALEKSGQVTFATRKKSPSDVLDSSSGFDETNLMMGLIEGGGSPLYGSISLG
jgi:hypothetical protein